MNFQKIRDFFKKSGSNDEALMSDDESIHALSDTDNPIRKGLWIVGLGLGLFLVWAMLAPIDSGSPSIGTLVVESKRKTIQHLTGGVIQEVLVREGEMVKEGQVLVRMLPTNSDSQLGMAEAHLKLVTQQINAIKELVQEGYYPKLQYEELLRQQTEDRLKIKVLKEELERVEIKSPIDGVVISMGPILSGTVLPSGGRLMDVVPANDRLVVEVMIAPHLIDKVNAGLEADVRFSALNQRITPVVQGKVQWVSADRISPQTAQQGLLGSASLNVNAPANPATALMDGYYTARIVLNEDAYQKIGNQHLKPGMPADVIIKTGARTFMSYLIKPFTDRAALSLKEQ